MEHRESLCPYSHQCGGCQLLNLHYEQQLARKQRRMEQLLGKFGRVAPIYRMASPWNYRTKVQRAVSFDNHKVHFGVYQSGTHRVVPVENCLIESEAAQEVLATVRKLMTPMKITAYDEVRGTGFLRHVLVREGHATGELLLVLVATSPIFPQQKRFLKEITAAHPKIRSVVLNLNDRFTPVVLGDREKVLYGDGYIDDVICGLTFRISSRSFAQVNPVQTEVLYRTAIEFAGLTGQERVLDAYCGIGTIGLIAAGGAREVLGVERNRDAVKDAIANAKRNKIKNAWFTQGDAGIAMEELAAQQEEADVVFLDPPRTGSSETFLQSLITMGPKRVVYISCGPDTLARDLETLTQGGYQVRRIQPVDMFPHTDHCEVVCLLSR